MLLASCALGLAAGGVTVAARLVAPLDKAAVF
jgi:hypothetical protein